MALDFGFGFIAGITGTIAGYPFDTVKVRLQTQTLNHRLYSGSLDCFVKIAKQESVLGFYKGMSSPMFGVALINGLVFSIQNAAKGLFDNPDTYTSLAMTGALAGGAQSFLCSPIELVKTRLQMQGVGQQRKLFALSTDLYKGPIDCLKKAYGRRGLRNGVMRGLSMTLARDIPSFAAYFPAWQFFVCHLSPTGKEADMPMHLSLIGGGFTGIAAWTVSYPFDVIKSRYQAAREHVYKGVWDCAMKSLRTEGWQVFTRGFVPCTMRAIPTNAFTYPVYSFLKRTFDAPADDDGEGETISSATAAVNKSTASSASAVSSPPMAPMQSM
jgi:solute carrier family 25 (mitochondrial carnitine/acylcarnitine transporter), member 20/29